jgi:hypothetical protein
MRHPNVAGAYDAHEDQIPHMRMTGWLTDDEWARAGLPEPPEPEPDDEPQDDEPDSEPDTSGEKKPKAPRRARSRATSEEESN